MYLHSQIFNTHEDLCSFVERIGLKRENIECITESTREYVGSYRNTHYPRYTLFYWE